MAAKRCGFPKPDGTPCGHWAGARTSHVGYGYCWLHGGRSPALTIAAEKERLTEQAMQLGAPIEIDPHEALLQEVYRAAGHVQYLQDKVRELGDDELSETNISGKVPSFWIRWYNQERMTLVNAAATCIKAGVAERRVQLAEEQGKLLAGAIRAILNQLGLTPEQERRAPEVVRSVLTALPAA